MKVIICVDYSSYTDRVLEGARIILGTRIPQPEVTILHVIDQTLLAAGTGAEPQIMEGLQSNSNKINELAKLYFGDDVTYLEEYGIPRAKIDEVLDEIPYDLLVFGTRGRSALTKLIMGSEAEHLLHNAKTPILIIP